uniref:Tyrosine specific protein phosphatases domain-containing protein n=1 Tax=Chlamydomonas euryale TaxID=1486919 RepID=A0A7R9VGJ5_9CHLO|mmetsp:Transcript_3440/g.9627  ORF Transcript_3440/g.9627 Transcript_3440/m.9627 type:complete len:254 (+) Transcript_3440:91-852(+)
MGRDRSLSTIVASVALLPAAGSAYLAWAGAPAPLLALSCWVTAVGFVVAAAATDALCLHTTGLLGKTREGRIRRASWVAWWPYHVGLRLKLSVGKLLTQEPLWDRVADGWYLGGWPNHASLLPHDNVSVVDVTCELPRAHAVSRYCVLPVWDTKAPTLQQLDDAVDFCLQESARGNHVYVHCAHGHGRSATVMAAALIKSGKWRDVDDAVARMQAVRPRVHLNTCQLRILREWDARRGSVEMAQTQQPNGILR